MKQYLENKDEYIEGKCGKPVLSLLPAEYDRDYYVQIDTVDWALLERSGYQISHRANITMNNYTRKNCSLNPHTKCGVDAAIEDGESITFQEYLELFEQAKA